MRLALLAVVAACTSTFNPYATPLDDGLEQHRVEVKDIAARVHHVTDLLIVVDDSPAMAAFHEQIVANAKFFIYELRQSYGGLPDLHIAVISADPADGGAFRRFGSSDFLTSETFYDGTSVSNAPDLEAALTELVDVSIAGSTVSQPLAMAKLALEHHPSFLRENADTAVIFIGNTPDASPESLAHYEQFFASLSQLKVSGILGTADCGQLDPRLRQFLAAFPSWTDPARICNGQEVSYVFELYPEPLNTSIADTCFEGAIDPERCVAADRVNGVDVDVLPRCSSDALRLPCFEVVTDERNCGLTDSQLQVRFQRHTFPPPDTHTHVECVVNE